MLIFLSDDLRAHNNASVPAKIIKINPNATVYKPERSVGFGFECIVEGDPAPNVTWARGSGHIIN